MQTYNLTKEIQQIQNSIGIIISCFFIKHNHTLVPKIDPDYINNQLKINALNYQELSDKMTKNTSGCNIQQSQFSTKHIEFLNKSISQIQLHDLSETTTSKHFDDKKIKEIEKNVSDVWKLIQKQKTQIQELGGLLQKYSNQPSQSNPQQVIKSIIIPENELSKLNAQIKGLNNQMSVFKNEINQYILDKKKSVTKSLKLVSGEYNKLLKMINTLQTNLNNINNLLNTKISALTTRLNTINTTLTSSISTTNAKIDSLNTATNTKVDNINSTLIKSITTTNTKFDNLNTATNTKIDTSIQDLSDYIDTNFGVLYQDTNQNSGRTVYFNKVKVNEIEFASSSNISDVATLSAAIGNLTTNFNSIYQNTNVSSDKTAYFSKVVSENIECSNFTGVSDERLKKNIVDLKNVSEDLRKLKTVGFDWKSNNEADIGFIAQDVEKIFPSLVKTNKDGFKSVKYVNFVPILVQGYREQADEIRKLKKILIIGFVVFFFFFMYKCI